MSETECVMEFKLGDAVVRRIDFFHWASGTARYNTLIIEAITISTNKTMYHTSGGGTYAASELFPAENSIMRGIEHLQARQTALIKMLKAKGDSNE